MDPPPRRSLHNLNAASVTRLRPETASVLARRRPPRTRPNMIKTFTTRIENARIHFKTSFLCRFEDAGRVGFCEITPLYDLCALLTLGRRSAFFTHLSNFSKWFVFRCRSSFARWTSTNIGRGRVLAPRVLALTFHIENLRNYIFIIAFITMRDSISSTFFVGPLLCGFFFLYVLSLKTMLRFGTVCFFFLFNRFFCITPNESVAAKTHVQDAIFLRSHLDGCTDFGISIIQC